MSRYYASFTLEYRDWNAYWEEGPYKEPLIKWSPYDTVVRADIIDGILDYLPKYVLKGEEDVRKAKVTIVEGTCIITEAIPGDIVLSEDNGDLTIVRNRLKPDTLGHVITTDGEVWSGV